jgi:L-iditol 2-dehydrogenase
MLMKALQAVRPGVFEQVQVPVPSLPPEAPERVLVRTGWVSMCGSDIPFFSGNKRFLQYPLAPGAPIHECVGEVVESTTVLCQPGDRVLSIPDGNQGLAELFVAQASRTEWLDPQSEDPGAACLIQPLSTVMNAVDRLGNIQGKTVAVVGLGSIGLLFCWLAKRGGAGAVIGIDPSAHRCGIAETVGATSTLCQRGIEVVHAVRQNPAGWNPPDICIEAVGHQMDTLSDCLELVRKYGTVVAFGVPDHPVYALEYEMFFRKNACLMATVTPDWTEYLAKARELFVLCREELSSLVTHRLPIREAGKAFGMYERHEDGMVKAILDAACW